MQSILDNLARPLLSGSRLKSQTTGTIAAPYESYPSALKTALQRADYHLDYITRYVHPHGSPTPTPVYVIIHQQSLPHTKSTIWSIHRSARTANNPMAAQFVSKCPEVLGSWPTSPWERKGEDMCVFDDLSDGEDMAHLFDILSGADRDFSEKDWESLSPVSTRWGGEDGDEEDSAWTTEDKGDGSEEESCPCRPRRKEAKWHFSTNSNGFLGISLVVEEPGKKAEVVKSVFVCRSEWQD